MSDATWTLLKQCLSVGRDLLSLVLAGMAIVLSRRALRLGEQQGQIIDQQLEMMKQEVETGRRLEELLLQQTRLTERLKEIAELQHQTLEEQRARKASLELFVDRVPSGLIADRVVYDLRLRNAGTGPAMGTAWVIAHPAESDGCLEFDFVDPPKEGHQMFGETRMHTYSGYLSEGIFVRRPYVLGHVTLKPHCDNVQLNWKVICADGEFPPKEVGWAYLKAGDASNSQTPDKA